MSTDINTLVDNIIADAEKKVRTDLSVISLKAKNDFIAKANGADIVGFASAERFSKDIELIMKKENEHSYVVC